ncbi:MAG: T9SS type A sorting domain-containing protein [candidate division WOR-3 bacterium]
MKKLILLISFLLMLKIQLLAQEWTVQQIDDGYIEDTSIAIDTQNLVHIGYIANGLVKYAKWNGIFWEYETIDTSGYYIYINEIKIGIDKRNQPHIVTCLHLHDSTMQVKYAYRRDSIWHLEKVDSLGCPITLFTNWPRRIDMAIDNNCIPHIVYPWLNITDSVWELRYAYKNDEWVVQTILRLPFTNCAIYAAKIAIDTANYPVISYSISDKGRRQLFCSFFNGLSWDIDTIVVTEAKFPISIIIDRMNLVHLQYMAGLSIRYAVKENNCWQHSGIIAISGSPIRGDMALLNNEPHMVASSYFGGLQYKYKLGNNWYWDYVPIPYCGLHPSLEIDQQGTRHLSCSSTDYDLLYATKPNLGIEEKNVGRTPISSELSLSVNSPVSQSKLKISYGLPKNARVKLTLYDLTGRAIKVLIDEYQNAGYYNNSLDLQKEQLTNGVYFLGLELDKDKKFKKIILIK